MGLLQYLETPVLTSLTLCYRDDQREVYNISPFLSFVSQPSFQLQTLALSCLPTTVDDLIDCLKATPTVIQLDLAISYHIQNSNPLFAKFAEHGDFLPQLESFDISLSGFPSIADPSLVLTALERRCISTAVVPLQHFRFAVSIYDTDPEEIDDPTEVYLQSFKSHALYPKLEAAGTNLSLGQYFLQWSTVRPK
ncbi:hypothetical protein C8R45DRAFT_975202 [Mycena sanguinolenta]|nr:hypothetical protein C8R45DRAFT_975202 [Mycena sanguinolenta]